MTLYQTPSQTVGPFLSIGLTWPDGPEVVPAATPSALVVGGVVYDGEGNPVVDGLVETWQADRAGRFMHPDDPRGETALEPAGFRGFGRSATDSDGRWQVWTVKPGAVPAADGSVEAPHINVSVFARGLLQRLVTRIYFPDEEAANAIDPVLSSVPEDRRHTLVAVAEDPGLRFDIHLQGSHETVFFDV